MRRRSPRITPITIVTPDASMHEIMAGDIRPSVQAARPPTPDAHRIHAMIMSAALRQVATTPSGRAIVAAGLGDELRELLREAAANVANPIVSEFEQALGLDE